MTNPLTHFDAQGSSRMVDVSAKPVTLRTARAAATVRMAPGTAELIQGRGVSKGDVIEIARLAGIMAAKQTSSLIPLCHPLPLDSVQLEFAFLDQQRLRIEALASATARTGVEMEALAAATVAALTVYDMCKSVDRAMVVENVHLVEKTGGRSGDYRRESSHDAPPTA